MRRVLMAIVLLATAGCMTPASERDRSPSYRLGFGDGCTTASSEGTGAPRSAQRNEMLYSSDSDYRAGWLSGHTQCRSQTAGSLINRLY